MAAETLQRNGYGSGGPKSGAGRGAAIRESMKQLLKSKATASSSSKAVPKEAPLQPPEPASAETPDAAERNEEFFRQMEKDYSKLCREDGWDEVMRECKEDLKRPKGNAASEAKVVAEIPAGSDYFRVGLPEGKDREIRCDPERGRKLLAQLPQKPPRNLDELRRVEQETQEAIEKERERLRSSASAPIRTKSDVVRIDSLESDSEEEGPRKGMNDVLLKGLEEKKPSKKKAVNLDSLSDGEAEEGQAEDSEEEDEEVKQKQENALAALKALEEFDRLGREKEAMLAKYRDKYL
eukprot:TRINITY_DN25265_c0_g1_i1.p1 TRINITY_DN25265_c0_g1~~TRINITY_DN25265_c0_g1_i1.p1  ORF type:complete len:301 (+),score=106.68 TRINITY_DN25265_c0_g1_i1:23-904(+)